MSAHEWKLVSVGIVAAFAFLIGGTYVLVTLGWPSWTGIVCGALAVPFAIVAMACADRGVRDDGR